MNRGLLVVIGCVVMSAVVAVVVLLDEGSSTAAPSQAREPGVLAGAESGEASEAKSMDLGQLAAPESLPLEVTEPGLSVGESDALDLADGGDTGTLVGRVTLAGSGDPVVGLVLVPRVEPLVAGSGDDETPQLITPELATTDVEGRYTFTTHGEAKLVSMQVLPAADIPRQRINFALELATGVEVSADFQVERGVQVSGRVVDLAGEPVAGATVNGWTGNHYLITKKRLATPDQTTVCDANGAFTIGGVGPSWLLAATADGMAAHQRVHGRHDSGIAVIGVTLVLSPERKLTGRVLGAGAQPVSGAMVSASVYLQGAAQTLTEIEGTYITGLSAVKATSDTQGRFELEGLASRAYEVSVSHPLYPEWVGEHDSGDGQLVVQLEVGLTLRGHVLSPAGQAVAGAQVRLSSAQMFGSEANSRSTRSDDSGAFVLEGLRPDQDGYLLLDADGFAVHVEQPVVIAEGQPDLTVVLAHPWSLAGRVIDDAGQPVPGALVEIEGDRLIDHGDLTISPVPTWEREFRLSSQRTDALGRFFFDRLYDGLFRVEASDESGELRTIVETRSGNEELELVLDPDAIIGVTLMGEARDVTTGLPVTEFFVTPMIPSGTGGMSGTSQQFQDELGQWRMVGLDAGPMMVNARAAGYAPWSLPLADYPGGEQRIDIAFAPKRTVVFRVVDEERQPLEVDLTFTTEDERQLMVETGPSSGSSRLETDEAGEARAAGLPAQRIVVTVAKGWLSSDREYTVDLTHEPSGPIELVYGATDEQKVMVMVFTGVPSDPSVLQISDLSSESAGQALQAELVSGALRPLPVPVSIDAVDDGGVVVASELIDPSQANPPGITPPGISGGFMAMINVPLRALTVSATAEGFAGATRSWIPESGEGPAVLVMILSPDTGGPGSPP